MTPDERQALIARYNQGYQAVVEALTGATNAELNSRPGPDEWTSREVVHHLADSEMTSALRLRKLLVEDRPGLEGYDEQEFARRLYYDRRPIEPALEALAAARRTTAQILTYLTDQDWLREGTHTERGRYTAETWLEIYAAHAHDHADQIRRARASLKP